MAEEGKENMPTLYEIRIKGHLGDRWADWYEGMTFPTKATAQPLSVARLLTRLLYTVCSTASGI